MKELWSICLVTFLAVTGAQVARETEHGSIRGYGVQEIYSYQAANKGYETLDRATLYWNVSSTQVTFNLTIDPEVHEFYNWFGIGLKDPSDSVSMINADFAVVRNIGLIGVLNNDVTVSQMNTFGYKNNSRPKNNTDNDLFNITSEFSTYTGKFWASWTRDLNTSTDETLNLTEGSTYTLLYAYGTIKDYAIQPHSSSNRGYGEITLSNDFSGKANIPSRKKGKAKPKDAELEWQVFDDRVIFNLTIDSNVVKNYDWYGIGLKNSSSDPLMVDADYMVFKNISEVNPRNFLHMNTFNATTNRRPYNDTSNEITKKFGSTDENGKVSLLWARELDISTNETLMLTQGSDYTLLYAYGKVADDTIQKHESSNRGYIQITLSNNYQESSALGLYSLLFLSVLQLL